MKRGIVAITIAFGSVAALVGCGSMLPVMGSYTETIPAALKASDIGVIEVAAGSSIDGLSRVIGVHLYLDHGTVSASDLRKTISIVVPLIDQPGASLLELTFSDASKGLESEFRTPLNVSDARAQLLSDWGAGKEFAFADSADDEIRGELSNLREYLRDTTK